MTFRQSTFHKDAKRIDRSGLRVFRSLKIDLASAPVEGKSPIRILGDGGLAIPARISRIGCLEYASDEGPPFSEYRDPTEVFSQESLDSFKGVTVTLLHPEDDVTPDNWRKHSIGHVADDVREDGEYVACTLLVKDAEAIRRIQAKELREISCGYWADVELTKGEHEGQAYDGVQKNIRGNHVAIGPGDWGRAGPQVRLQIDSKKRKKDQEMLTYQEMIDMLAKLVADGVLTQEQADSFAAELEDPAKKVEEPAADSEEEPKEDPAAEEKKTDAMRRSFQDSLEIRDHARIVMGTAFVMPKTDNEIMLAVIRSEDPKFDSKRGAEYTRARFDMVQPKAAKKDASESPFAPLANMYASPISGEASGSGNTIKDRQNAHYDSMTGKVK